MFDPEHKDIDCPKCLRQRVYFDREIGCYCMFCGYVLSAEETLLQMEKRTAMSPPAVGSDKKGRMPIIEVKARRPQRARTGKVKQSPELPDDKKSE